MLPSAEALHLRGSGEIYSPNFPNKMGRETVSARGGAAEAEERTAAGSTKNPEAVPEQLREKKRRSSTEQHSHRHRPGRSRSPAWLPLTSPTDSTTKTPPARRRGWPEGSGPPIRTRTKIARTERPPEGAKE